LREPLDQHLEKLRLAKIYNAAVIIQKNIRKYVLRKKYLKMRQSAIVIQSYIRKFLDRYLYCFMFELNKYNEIVEN
jgi:myosin heavy subunit